MNRNEMEQQLWEFIDGRCDETAGADIAHKITTDMQWKNLYKELTALNATIPASLYTDQPSVRFTKNVMEAVARTNISPVARRYFNPVVIRAIAGLFIMSIIAILIYAISNAEAQAASATGFDITGMLQGKALQLYTWATLLVGLLFLDAILRGNRHRGHYDTQGKSS